MPKAWSDLSEETRERYRKVHRDWKKRNRQHVRKYRKEYYAQNWDREQRISSKWKLSHPERVNEHRRRDYQKNARRRMAKRIKSGWCNRYQKERYKSDIQFRLHACLNASLNQALRRAGLRKTEKTFDLIGCSPQFLVTYLESKFLPGMSWQNRSEIEIDHIRPVISFDLTDPAQRSACYHYTNLQPLWKTDNRRKGGKWITPV